METSGIYFGYMYLKRFLLCAELALNHSHNIIHLSVHIGCSDLKKHKVNQCFHVRDKFSVAIF